VSFEDRLRRGRAGRWFELEKGTEAQGAGPGRGAFLASSEVTSTRLRRMQATQENGQTPAQATTPPWVWSPS